MAKIVTKKSQIPKSAQKRIRNFAKLTDNQAILQYELNKLKRRLSKQVDYTKFIKIPKVITKSFIKEIHNIRGLKVEGFKKKFEQGKPLTEYEERKEIERKRNERKVFGKSVDEQLAEISDDELYYDYVWDLEEEAAKEHYDSPDTYLRGTNQTIDPDTGEVLDKEEYISKQLDLVKEFFDDLRTEIDNSANQSIIINSTYKNGRTRNTRSRQWITDNITRAKDKLITLIDSIEADEDRSISVYERFANDSSALSDLQDAISEYLAGSYSSVITSAGTDMNYQRVYAMLSGSPMSLEEAEEFEV